MAEGADRAHPVQRGSEAAGRCDDGVNVPLARAGLMLTQRRLLDVNGRRNPQDGRMVDALALAAEEGRGHAAKCPGEALAA